MLLFRDEEHVERWAERGGHPKGGVLTPEQLWDLARIWYENRLEPDWRRRTADEAQAVFEEIGLTGPFWDLRAG
jgi:Alkylmercury lyase